MGRRLMQLVVLVVVLLLVAQVVPYGRDHANPPVVQEPQWDHPDTRALARTACFDCHSNETVWPWYTNVAPASWVAYRDVVEARETLNFSEWQNAYEEAEEAAEEVNEGNMPPRKYTVIHTDAQLSEADRSTLVAGLQATLGGSLEGGEEGEDEEEEERGEGY